MDVALAVTHRPTAADVVAAARAAEEHRVGEVWLAEDLGQRGAFTLAGAMAHATTRVRLGLGVVGAVTRHPYLTAMETATLAELAPGRVILGLGAGAGLEAELGIVQDRPLRRLVEATALVRSALDPARGPHHGPELTARHSVRHLPPAPVPVVWGVKGRRALALAAEQADGVLLSTLTTAPYVRHVREAVGPRTVLRAYVFLATDDDPATAAARVREDVARILAGQSPDDDLVRCSGIDPGLVHAVRARLRAGQDAGALLGAADLRRFVVLGTPDERVEAFGRLASSGLDTVVVRGVASTHLPSLLREVSRVRTVLAAD